MNKKSITAGSKEAISLKVLPRDPNTGAVRIGVRNPRIRDSGTYFIHKGLPSSVQDALEVMRNKGYSEEEIEFIQSFMHKALFGQLHPGSETSVARSHAVHVSTEDIDEMIRLIVEEGLLPDVAVNRRLTGLERRLRQKDVELFGRPGLWGRTKGKAKDIWKRHKYSILTVGVPATTLALYGARRGLKRSFMKQVSALSTDVAKDAVINLVKSPEVEKEIARMGRQAGRSAAIGVMTAPLTGVSKIRSWIRRKHGV